MWPICAVSRRSPAHLCRRTMAVALDQPALVIGLLPGNERKAKLLDRVEGTDPQELLVERADDAVGTAVALGRPHERGTGLYSPEGDLILEIVSELLRAVIAANR